MKLGSMTGTKVFKCAAGTAGTEGADYIELPGIEETSGGGIKNNSIDYTPHDTGIKHKVATSQEYSDVKVSVADDLTDGAFGDSVVTILNDAAKKRENFDLVKMVPAGNSEYKVTVWTGYVVEANTDDAKAENLQRGDFTMIISNRNEFTGTIEGNKPRLTPRQ